MEHRKIIQITIVSPPVENGIANGYNMVLALCNDGTLWWSNMEGDREVWQRYENIPQN